MRFALYVLRSVRSTKDETRRKISIPFFYECLLCGKKLNTELTAQVNEKHMASRDY